MKRFAAVSLTALSLGAGLLSSAGTSPTLIAPYRSGVKATQQMAPAPVALGRQA